MPLDDRPSASVVAPAALIDAAVVTPTVGPPGQEPALPLNLQNAVVGGGQTLLTNVMSSGLTGDPDLFKFGVVCNVAAQLVKGHPKFNEKAWTLPFMVIVGVSFCCWYFRDPTHCCDLTHPFWAGYLELPGKGVLDGIVAAFQGAANYHGMAATGVSPMKPVGFDNSMEGAKARAATIAQQIPGGPIA